MFTGIIYCKARIKKIKIISKGKNIEFFCEKDIKNIHKGMSIAVNGVCLTIVSFSGSRIFSVDISKETIEKTTFKYIRHSSKVNIEMPLTIDNFISGHIVQGHIDTIGEVNYLKKEPGNTILEIIYSEKFSKFIVEKGSIAVDGVSLTAFDVRKNLFKISLIPETLNSTIINEYKKRDKVNLEFDIIGKYVKRMFNKDIY